MQGVLPFGRDINADTCILGGMFFLHHSLNKIKVKVFEQKSAI